MKIFAGDVLSVEVNGIQGHSGTTPMEMRSDALVRAAGIIAMIDKIAIPTFLNFVNNSEIPIVAYAIEAIIKNHMETKSWGFSYVYC